MQILFEKKFIKQQKKLDTKIKVKFDEKLKIFVKNKFEVVLQNHKLRGYNPERFSINITGDYRVHYEIVDVDTCLFVEIGTHSELYK